MWFKVAYLISGTNTHSVRAVLYRMDYLLVVLAVALVPVVTQNQSHVPSSTSSSCPVAVNQVSSQVDQPMCNQEPKRASL